MDQWSDGGKQRVKDKPATVLARIEAARQNQEFELNLAGEGLTALPESIGQLTELRRLNLSYNQLTQLPGSIGHLMQLHELNLSHNRLKQLPVSLSNLSALKALYLHGNDELGLIPMEVLGPPWQEVITGNVAPAKPSNILEYYYRLKGGLRPLNEAKLILVGRGGVGKTSLVNRLVHDTFHKNEQKTDGIRVTKWLVRLHGNEDVRLNIWDFGGQEIMHATHQFFLTQRSLYLLVITGREGTEDMDAEYWLKLIESFGGDSPVIIVCNKVKEHPFELNRRALQQKYASIRDFIETDCSDKTGIEAVWKAIERETDRLEHLRDAFPLSWFAIKDALAEMEKNYLSFDEYRVCCRERGEADTGAQDLLAGYLHNLGIILNYKDDPRLQDTHVLNRYWVTEGIYRILNSVKVKNQKGEIHLGDLAEILNECDYPPSMRRFLLDLMKKFDLCFSFPEDDTRYLIPELLDKEEAMETAEFKPEDCLNFQYHYPVLPEGLLPRFIVRTHVLSEGLPRWRTGVILKFEGNRALVKGDIQDKKVLISVSGPVSGRRGLLAIIRSDFGRIHSNIRNLQPLEMVPLPKYPGFVVPYRELQVMQKHKMEKLQRVVEDQIVELDVEVLLHGIDLEQKRSEDAPRQAVRLFYSYAHRDEELRNHLETHLKLMQRQGLIESWHDRDIEAGGDWKQRIDENLERADVILLLVSANFIASDYCYNKELQRALERHEKGEARVIPIIIRDVNWKGTPFANLQALPQNGRPVTKWSNRDSAWRNIAEGIERVVEQWSTGQKRWR